MAHPQATKRKFKKQKNRETKVNLVFDEKKRREFLTGFRKRKLQRKQAAKERLEKQLKLEQKRIKAEAKENFKKLVLSHRGIPELDDLLNEQQHEEEYEDDDVTVKVVELNPNDIAIQNNWIGDNKPCYLNTNQIKQEEEETANDENSNRIKGMELRSEQHKQKEQKEFKSKKEVKKMLKKKATQKVQQSDIFKKKNQYERKRQLKKSRELKKQQKRQEKHEHFRKRKK